MPSKSSPFSSNDNTIYGLIQSLERKNCEVWLKSFSYVFLITNFPRKIVVNWIPPFDI